MMQARSSSLALTLAMALVLGAPGLPRAAETLRPEVPVQTGGDVELDACAASGSVVGLDPKGDNFLSVRGGPGGSRHAEIDRIHTGLRVAICDEDGVWLGIVYSADPEQDCGVATFRPKRGPYTGPCRSGWVHGRYIGNRAG